MLTLDMIGGMVAAYLMVLIDSYADEARVKATGERVHHRRFFFEEVCPALAACCFRLLQILVTSIGAGKTGALARRARKSKQTSNS